MIHKLRKIKFLSLPISYIYQFIVGFRNFLFNIGVLQQKKYSLPIISVGNITVGGTGKTPHTEYILSLLSPIAKVAMLSRGYKRSTKGFLVADENSTATEIGDEPYQIHRKFKDVIVAIDANRRRGIETLRHLYSQDNLDAIVLDDAYQHRYVEPGLNILLMNYNQPIYEDYMLPYGNLREPFSNRNRAQIIIVTKCPTNATPIEYRLIKKNLQLRPYQNLYFSHYKYGYLRPVFSQTLILSDDYFSANDVAILLFTGIVSQDEIIQYLGKYSKTISTLEFPDHHKFNTHDFKTIIEAFSELKNQKKIIVTTEKDAARIYNNPLVPEELKAKIYCLPITVEILFDQEKTFKKQIIDFVKKNKTSNFLFEKKSNYKTPSSAKL